MDGSGLHAWREIGEYFSVMEHCEMIDRIVLGWEHFKLFVFLWDNYPAYRTWSLQSDWSDCNPLLLDLEIYLNSVLGHEEYF